MAYERIEDHGVIGNMRTVAPPPSTWTGR